MSVQPLVYEGPDLEQLLGEIISVHGSNVRLGEPTKVRKGGVGGFFATVHYRVEVHPLEPTAVTSATTAPAAEAIAHREPQPHREAEARREPEARRAPEARHEPEARREPEALDELGVEASTTIDALEALAAGTADVFELTDPGAARPRSFDDALAAAAASLGEDPQVGALAFDERDELILANPGVAHPPTGGPRGEPAHSASAPQPRQAQAGQTLAIQAPAPQPQVGQPLIPQPLAAQPAATQPLAVQSPVAPVAPQPDTANRGQAGAEALSSVAAGATGVVHDLIAVGFPVALSSAALGRHDAALTMEHAFSLLPAARQLPLTPGSLIAIVGPANRAFDVARSMAAAIGVAEQEIAFVSGEPKRNPPRIKFAPDLVAHDVRGVVDLSPGWRRGRVAVVAVSCPVLSGEHRVVRDLLDAMRPSATIAIADARSKSEDVAFFCDGLGGVDAIVLDRISETLTPASLTAVGIPVARLGDSPATPEEWTRLATAALRRRRGEVVEV